ncbi:MAG: SOS response-associated peptidase [Acholeplasmataceae bacterium]|nr:SOS response-associated peptidase [Acholeplasmataceae bacterium]
MCGRFTITVTMDELKEYLKAYYDIEEIENEFDIPRYNVSPGQEVITIINDGNKNRIGLLKWGFVPPFAKDEKTSYTMINAKAETLHEKISYKGSFEHKRCVILADGFYEWKKEKDHKQPIRILMKDHKIFPIAGLYATYQRQDGSKLHTCTLITTEANKMMSSIHERMPVILTEEHRKVWLNPHNTDIKQLSLLLTPYESDHMISYKVSNIVNQTKNDLKMCIEPLA